MLNICKPIILGSNSPRRKNLLKMLGIDFQVVPSNADECIVEKDPALFVEKTAFIKADEVYKRVKINMPSFIIITADTVVACDGEILGKPENESDAFEMLRRLKGKNHAVYTGICVMDECGEYKLHSEKSTVYIDQMTDSEINSYIRSGECFDKAGAFDISGSFARYIPRIEGCYYNIVGLPLSALKKLLEGYGIICK